MNIKHFTADGDLQMNYILTFPDKYEELPLLVYLHGAGERGKTLEHLYRHGIPKLIKDGREYPAIILCPQCPGAFIWNNMVKELKALIDTVAEEYGVLKDRIVLTGSSMGGYGTWEMGMCYPETFAAIAPVAGGGIVWRASRLVKTPVFAYHGEMDPTVPISQSRIMVDYTNQFGGCAELITLDGFGHNDGINYAYRETDLIDRLLCCRKTDFSRIPEPCEQWY